MHEVERTAVVEEARQSLSRKRFLLGAAGILGGGALMAALPNTARAHETDPNVTDEDILNYALTLEHLEAIFYVEGLKKFNRADFKKMNFSNEIRKNLERIRDHEVEHVDTLIAVIEDPNGVDGEAVPPADEYDFSPGFASVRKFIQVAQLLENTGVSAYTGAIAHVNAAGLLTAGSTIATVEARHASYLNLINDDVPFPAAFDTPETPRDICQLVDDRFIVSAPTPYGPYPSLEAFCAMLPDSLQPATNT
ncbi:MAG: ferritin-like domain-containing protein [Rubrobacteraceae bacterium]